MGVGSLQIAGVDSTILCGWTERALPPCLFHVHLSWSPLLNQKEWMWRMRQ